MHAIITGFQYGIGFCGAIIGLYLIDSIGAWLIDKNKYTIARWLDRIER